MISWIPMRTMVFLTTGSPLDTAPSTPVAIDARADLPFGVYSASRGGHTKRLGVGVEPSMGNNLKIPRNHFN
jgi:hypothetical protein